MSKSPSKVPVKQLLTMMAAYNPRKMSEHDMEALRRSLREFGPVEAIVVNARTNRVVGGHQRIRAAAAEEIEMLPVHWVDLTDVKEKQLNLALNRIHGDWDEDLLRLILIELKGLDEDLLLTGFLDDEVERLIAADALSGILDDPVPPRQSKAIDCRATIMIPTRVWLTAREELITKTEELLRQYGVKVEWPS